MPGKAFASSADLAEKEQTLELLADGVYALTAEGDPNVGAIEGDDFLVCFEAMATPAAAREWLAQLRERTDKPVRYLVLSHYHAVRVLGASAFGAGLIVTHEKTRELIAERGRVVRRRQHEASGLVEFVAAAQPLRAAKDVAGIVLGRGRHRFEQLAGIAAVSARERAAAKLALADVCLSEILDRPVIDPDHDEVSLDQGVVPDDCNGAVPHLGGCGDSGVRVTRGQQDCCPGAGDLARAGQVSLEPLKLGRSLSVQPEASHSAKPPASQLARERMPSVQLRLHALGRVVLGECFAQLAPARQQHAVAVMQQQPDQRPIRRARATSSGMKTAVLRVRLARGTASTSWN